MIHNEHLRKSDESYEICHDNNGNAIHVYIKDGEAIVFPTLVNFIDYVFMAANRIVSPEEIERFYLSEKELENLYDIESYNYYQLKSAFEDK